MPANTTDDSAGIAQQLKTTTVAPAREPYRPPSMRNKDGAPATPAASVSSFLASRPTSLRQASSTSFDRSSGGSFERSAGSGSSSRGFSGGFSNSRSNKADKEPTDEFYLRDDVKGRNQRVEQTLFGSQHNSGINFGRYEDIPVEVSGNEPPAPIDDFENSKMDALAKYNVKLAGYSSATPVQRHSVGIVTAGRDLMACAQTGSGKVLLINKRLLRSCCPSSVSISLMASQTPRRRTAAARSSHTVLFWHRHASSQCKSTKKLKSLLIARGFAPA